MSVGKNDKCWKQVQNGLKYLVNSSNIKPLFTWTNITGKQFARTVEKLVKFQNLEDVVPQKYTILKK